MFDLLMINFETLETKNISVYRWTGIGHSIKKFFPESDEISLKDEKCFIKKEGKVIGGCTIKEYEKTNFDVFNGDVFFVDLGECDGTSVQSGMRPALIVSNNSCNKHSDIISIIPLTSQVKTQLPTHVVISPNEYNGLTEISTVMCEQIISISKSKLKNKMGYFKSYEMKKVDNAIRIQLNIKN